MKNGLFLFSLPAVFILFSCAGNKNNETQSVKTDSIIVVSAVNRDTAGARVTDSVQVEVVTIPETKITKKQKVEKKVTEEKKEEKIKAVIVDASREVPETKGKTYRIKAFSIAGDILSVDVHYKGGCGQHEFNLYSNGLLKKSLPPQVDVYLEHTKENETCNDDVKQTLKFDISPLKRQGNTKIIVNINTAENKAEWIILQ